MPPRGRERGTDLDLRGARESGNHKRAMKRLPLLLLAAGLAAIAGCRDRSAPPAAPPVPKADAGVPDVALLVHFAGGEALSKNPDAATQSALFQLPESRAVRQAALEKLVLAAARGWFAGTNDSQRFIAPLRPLLADAANVESLLGVGSKTGEAGDWALAMRLGPARIGAWSNGLAAAITTLRAHSKQFTSINGTFSAELAGASPAGNITARQAGDWLVLAGGSGRRELSDHWLARARAGSPPAAPLGANWLRIESSPQLAALLGWSPAIEWPRMTASFASRTNSVRTDATLTWITPHGFSPGPWRVPTNSLRDPLISFTAVRGIAPMFQRNASLRALGLEPPPNQCFVWSRSDIPFQTLLALPAKDAASRVAGMQSGLDALARAAAGTNFVGVVTNRADRGEVIWSGLPILVPFVRAAPEPAGDFLLGGLMAGIVPQGSNTTPPPAELVAQLTGRANLVFYDWEVTQNRLDQWRQTWQLFAMVAGPGPLGPRPGQSWLVALAPQLGNTITEAAVTSPNSVSVVRKSHAGFTGIELLLLARWLDNPDFPAWTYPTPRFPGLPPPGK
jgi:hypothetical protein